MSSLIQIVMAHHSQAAHMARKTFRCQPCTSVSSGIEELKRHGNKFTTRVEKRLRKLESGK